MRNNKKIIIAAALAVYLSGCAANSADSGAPLSSPSTSISTYSTSSEIAPETTQSEPEAASNPETSTTAAASSSSEEISDAPQSESVISTTAASTSAASESKTPEASETESEDDYVSVGWLTAPKGYKPPKSSVSETKKTTSREEELVDALIEELGLNDGEKSDMEKLCIFGKWLCDNTEYDHDFVTYTGTESGAEQLLALRGGRCETYAKTACLVFSGCGIDTLYCSAYLVSDDHAWNAVKIDGQWTYTDFVGGPDTLILGSSYHGLSQYTVINHYFSLHGYGYDGAKPDISEISTDLHLFDFDGNELEVHEEADGFSYVDSSGQRGKYVF